MWVQAPRLFDEFRVDEDFRSFHWMNKFQDPELFPDDQLGGYLYVNLPLPWGDLPLYFRSLGYGLLFYVASFVVNPVFFSKALPFVLMPVAVWYLFKYGQVVRDQGVGTFTALGFLFLNLASTTALSVVPGLQRSFAFPLMVMLLYYLHCQKYAVAGAVVLASALIYPPVFLLAMISWGIFILRLRRRPKARLLIVRPGAVALLIIALLTALILSPVLFSKFSEAFLGGGAKDGSRQTSDASPTYEHLWDNPQYGPGGRQSLFDSFPLVGRGGLIEKELDTVHLLILFTVGCLIGLIRGRRAFDLPREVWCALWASLIVYAASWLAIWLTDSFLLYLPSRYTKVGLFLFLPTFVFLNGKDAVAEALLLIQRNRKRLIWLVVGTELLVWIFVLSYPSDVMMFGVLNVRWLLGSVALVFGVLGMLVARRRSPSALRLSEFGQTLAGRVFVGAITVVGLVGWGAYARFVSSGYCLNPSPSEREMLKFVETLPKDTLLAGTPCALDNIPLFAKRQILFSCEKIGRDPTLIREALDAYYADNAQAVVDFCRAYGVEYMVVDYRAYTEEYLEAGWVFFEPYNQQVFPLIAERDTFVLKQVPDTIKAFQSGDYFVFPCNELALQGR